MQNNLMESGGQFGQFSVSTQLKRREILRQVVLDIGGVEVMPYLIRNSAYPSRLYLLKNFKPSATNLVFSNKKRFNQTMNCDRIVTEDTFGALKVNEGF